MSVLNDMEPLLQRQQELKQRLTALREYEGVALSLRANYLHALLQRASAQRPGITRKLLDRTEAGISALEDQHRVAPDKEGLMNLPVPHAQTVRRLIAALVQLNRELTGADHPESGSVSSTLAAALAEQDRAFRQQLANSGHIAISPVVKSELHAARHLDTLRTRFQLDRLIATALVQQPEAPGPLNPQRLLVRLLTTLHGVSPAYLARTLDYTRALFELQRLAEPADSSKAVTAKK